MKQYRVECKTIAEHPSQNRRWFTFANAHTPAGAVAEVRMWRPGQKFEVLSIWENLNLTEATVALDQADEILKEANR